MINRWLLSRVVRPDEYPRWAETNVAMIDSVPVDRRLKNGDIIYLYIPEHDAVYGWGYADIRETEQLDTVFLTVAGGKIRNFLTEPKRFKNNELLEPLLKEFIGATAFLLNKQVRELDKMMSFQGPRPPLPTNKQFIFDQSVETDEGLYIEFKEVGVNNIPKHAYEFAIAYLRGLGGKIYFGIRDGDKKPIGIKLNHTQRDELLKSLEGKLSQIRPQVRANRDYFLTLHKIIDVQGNEMEDLFVFEVEVIGDNKDIHTSSSGKIYEKTYSGKIKRK